MRAATTIICVFFLGNLSLGTTQNRELTDEEKIKIREKLRSLGHDTSMMNFGTLPDSKVPDFETEMREMCEINCDSEAYDNFVNGTLMTRTCMVSKTGIDVYQQFGELVAKASSNRGQFVDWVCSHKEAFSTCNSAQMVTLKPCFDVGERRGIDMLDQIFSSTLDFVCEENGKNMLSFIDVKGPECVASRLQDLMNCFSSAVSTYNFTIPNPEGTEITQKPILMLRRIFNFLRFEKEECCIINEIQACVKKELSNCQSVKPAYYVDATMDAMKKPTPCNSAHMPKFTNIMLTSMIIAITSVRLIQ